MLLPEFHEADINLLFHKLQAGYCFKCRLWCIRSGTDRNTNKRIPKDTEQRAGERGDFPPMPGTWDSGKPTKQPDFINKSELNRLNE